MLKKRKHCEGGTMSERNTFTIRIRPDLMKAMKLLSVEKDTTMSDLIEEAIQDYLKKGGTEIKKPTKR
jgi:predicted transcriptional regulator